MMEEVNSSNKNQLEVKDVSGLPGNGRKDILGFRIPRILALVTLAVVILLGCVVLILKYQELGLPLDETTPNITDRAGLPLVIDNSVRGPVLVSGIPNFEKIKLDDISFPYEIRGVFNYGDDLIVGGPSAIIQYDPIGKVMVRRNDTGSFSCVNNISKIGNKLYVACNGYDGSKAGIYVVDLPSGMLIKSYHGNVHGFPSLRNIHLTSKDSILWIGTMDGVIKLDILDGEMKFYSQEDLGFQGTTCGWYNIYANNSSVWVNPQATGDCSPGVSLYNEVEDSWAVYLSDAFTVFGMGTEGEFTLNTCAYSRDFMYLTNTFGLGCVKDYILSYDISNRKWVKIADAPEESECGNLEFYRDMYFPNAQLVYEDSASNGPYSYLDENTGSLKSVQFELPLYRAISNRVNNKYYLLAEDGIYIFTKDRYPRNVSSATPMRDYDGIRVFVDDQESFMVLAGAVYGAPGHEKPPPMLRLFNVKTSEVTDLFYKSVPYDQLPPELQNKIDRFPDIEFKGVKDGVLVMDSETKEELMRVDLTKKEVEFR